MRIRNRIHNSVQNSSLSGKKLCQLLPVMEASCQCCVLSKEFWFRAIFEKPGFLRILKRFRSAISFHSLEKLEIQLIANIVHLRSSVADTDQGCGAYLTPGSGMGKKSGSGSGMNNPDHISESLESIFWGNILKFFYTDPGSGMGKFGPGMEKIRIRYPG